MALGSRWTFTGAERRLRGVAAIMGWKQRWDFRREQWDSDPELRKSYDNSIEKYQKAVQPDLLRAAKTLIDLTQFNYHTINTPQLIRRSGTARLILQFKKWTINQTNLIYRNLGKPLVDVMGRKAAREEVERAVRLTSAYALAAGATYFTANLDEILDEASGLVSGKSKASLKTASKAAKKVMPGGINFLNFFQTDYTEFGASVNDMLYGHEMEKKYSFFGKDPFTWAAGPTLGVFLDALISFGMANDWRKKRFRWDALQLALTAIAPSGKAVALTALGSKDAQRIFEFAVDPRDLPEEWRRRDKPRSWRAFLFGMLGLYPFDFDKKKRPYGGKPAGKRKRDILEGLNIP